MNRTPIEWCRTYAEDGSFEEGFSVNPVRFRPKGSSRLTTMCQKVSPGCAHCYAEGITRRFWPKDAEVKFPGYTALGVVSGEFVLDEKTLFSVFKRKKPARVFWGDMTDLFQESVPDEFLDKCFAVAALTPHLTHMFLTKRPERMLRWFEHYRAYSPGAREMVHGYVQNLSGYDPEHPKWIRLAAAAFDVWPLPNVQFGVSVENQEQTKRIVDLLQTPAAVRFISAEPLLGSIDLTPFMPHWKCACGALAMPLTDDTECKCQKPYEDEWSRVDSGLDWVIVGGESGTGARMMQADWARSLRDQCKAAGVPYFFKQWGSFLPDNQNPQMSQSPAPGASMGIRMPKKAAGCLLDGVEHHEFPAVSA